MSTENRSDTSGIQLTGWSGGASINNTEIGDLFGGLSYSAVSNVSTRFSEKLEKDRKIRRGVQQIMRDLSHVNGLLPKYIFEQFV